MGDGEPYENERKKVQKSHPYNELKPSFLVERKKEETLGYGPK